MTPTTKITSNATFTNKGLSFLIAFLVVIGIKIQIMSNILSAINNCLNRLTNTFKNPLIITISSNIIYLP